MTSWSERDQRSVWHPYDKPQGDSFYPIIERGLGSLLYTVEGDCLIDAISSWWVTLHGHGKPQITAAITEQASKLDHCIFARFTHKPAVQLSEMVLRMCPPWFTKAFYSDNGSTAVEVALKMALQYHQIIGNTCNKFIYLEGGYHGDTFGAMSTSHRGIYPRAFQSLLFEAVAVPRPTHANITNTLRILESHFIEGGFAGFIFEPLVQGAAGFKMYEPELIRELLTLCKKYQVLTIADEVMTGFGRTGELFAMATVDTEVDLLCAAKGLTGGVLPLALTLCSPRIVEVFSGQGDRKLFFHGHSYTANPIACAAAMANLNLLDEVSCQNRRRINAFYQSRLRSLSSSRLIESVRVQGTIFAIDLVLADQGYSNPTSSEISRFFLKRGVLIRPLGNTIYFIPPFETTDNQLKRMFETLEEFLYVRRQV